MSLGGRVHATGCPGRRALWPGPGQTLTQLETAPVTCPSLGAESGVRVGKDFNTGWVGQERKSGKQGLGPASCQWR